MRKKNAKLDHKKTKFHLHDEKNMKKYEKKNSPLIIIKTFAISSIKCKLNCGVIIFPHIYTPQCGDFFFFCSWILYILIFKLSNSTRTWEEFSFFVFNNSNLFYATARVFLNFFYALKATIIPRMERLWWEKGFLITFATYEIACGWVTGVEYGKNKIIWSEGDDQRKEEERTREGQKTE